MGKGLRGGLHEGNELEQVCKVKWDLKIREKKGHCREREQFKIKLSSSEH